MTLPNPTLVCEFARTKRLPSDLTFTRASIASYVDSNGYIQYVDTDEARFDHTPIDGTSNGLLIEESRTNKLLYSSDQSNTSVWSHGQRKCLSNFGIAPDGTYTADLLVPNSGVTGSWGAQLPAITAGQPHTLSVWVKGTSGVGGYISLYWYNTTDGDQGTKFNPITGVRFSNFNTITPTSYSSTAYPNGWFRLSITFTPTSAASFQVGVRHSDWTANGIDGVYIWGAQLEQATFPTSYMPSTETFTSRASTATYFDSVDGLLKTTPTNLITYSQDFTNAAWTKTNVLAFSSTGSLSNIAIAPDGTKTASKIIENTANGSHDIATTFSTTSGVSYTVSAYLRPAERTKSTLIFGNGASWASVDVDVANGTNLGQYYSGLSNAIVTITDVGFGWKRVSLQVTAANTTTTTFNIRMFGSASTYTGDGSSGLYVWGAQANIGPIQTYSVTTTTAITSGGSRPHYNDYSKVNRGMLLEPAATNLITLSQSADNAYWSKVNVAMTANTTLAPDGSMTADTVAINTTSSLDHYFEVVPTTGANQTSTASFFVKMGTQRYVRLHAYSYPTSANNAWVAFDLSTGSAITSAANSTDQHYSIAPYPNGWFRISQTVTFATSTDTQRYVRLFFCNNIGATTYVGAVTDNFYVWGAQLEIGGLTSYIPTFGSTVTRAADLSSSAQATRAADVCYINTGDWLNKSEGTLYTTSQLKNIASSSYPRVIQLEGLNAASDYMTIHYPNSLTGLAIDVKANNTSTFYANTAITSGSASSMTFAYKTNDSAVSVNGATVTTDTSVTLISNPVRLSIGCQAINSAFLNGTINRLYYWPKRIPNTDLENLSGL